EGRIRIFDNCPAVPATPAGSDAFELDLLGSYSSGVFDEGAAEIVAHDPASQQVFFTNANANSIGILDITDPAAPTLVTEVSMDPYGGGVNSVAVANSVIAVAVEGNNVDDAGTVVFLDTLGAVTGTATVGVLPDMLLFSPDGTKVLTANEGQPDDDYLVDPEGSVSIVNISGGVAAATVTTVGFAGWNDSLQVLLDAGVRIFGPDATVAQDLEPEYITIEADGNTAYVVFQENNALGVIDLTQDSLVAIVPLGFKDHSCDINGFDPSNRDDAINIGGQPTLGMYQPDAITSYVVNGTTYLVTANEGDARDYDGFSEEVRVADLQLDPTAYPTAAVLQEDENLGRLRTTNAYGDTDGDGDIDQIYSYGARSFSIWNTAGELVYDSGSEFERLLAEFLPDDFNSNNDENDSFDSRSDDKGPEPEAVTVVTLNDTIYALIGLERVGGVMVYDVTDPTAPAFVSYTNNRDFSVEAQLDDDSTNPEVGDLGIEDIIYIEPEDSPNGFAIVVTANEVSGTVSLFGVNTPPVSTDPELNLAELG
ncbi:MAG: choice-of-anchor I family protein, partial [Bacteroidota bacterium]